jgi:choline-sulfatase
LKTVVIISIDTLRSDVIAANPFKEWPAKHSLTLQPQSSAIDSLVRNGCYFLNCVSAAPYTSASHASYFTGKWPLRHGVFELYNRKLKARTIFDMARQQGYRTVFKVDFPITLGESLGFRNAADEYFVEDEDAALRSIQRGQPVFAFFHFSGLHIPYGFHNLKYGGEAYRAKVRELSELAGSVADKPRDELVLSALSAEDYALLMKYNSAVQKLYEDGRYRDLFNAYLQGAQRFFVTRFDQFFERLMNVIDPEDSLICLFGDHGEDYDEGTIGHFNSVNDGVLRVPLIFCGPSVRTGMYHDRIRSVDFAPTLLDLLGFPREKRAIFDGVSLSATVTSAAPYSARRAFAQTYTAQIGKYVRFQKRLLSTGRKTGHLPHVLSKEVIYEGGFRLVREHQRYLDYGETTTAVNDAPRLERLAKNHTWHPMSNIDIEQDMLEKLTAYNSLRHGRTDRLDMPEGVRRQLVAMGYRV